MNDETLAEAENTQRLLRALFRERGDGEGIVAVVHEAARSGKLRPLPEELSSTVRAALGAVGITQLYGHQRAAYDLLGEGAHVVVGTGTASGKSLCYQLPLLDRLTTERRSNSLLLFPTKALTQNQVRKLLELRIPNAVPMVYDGDTPDELRATVRRTATSLLTNPDMLHMGILPNHERWAEYLHHLHYVVIDEAHVYRGVFGSHTAHVIRRLRRLCALYGSSPQFILTSATIANPQEHAERLVGLPFTVVDDDEAPRAERTIVFTNPRSSTPRARSGGAPSWTPAPSPPSASSPVHARSSSPPRAKRPSSPSATCNARSERADTARKPTVFSPTAPATQPSSAGRSSAGSSPTSSTR